MRAASRSRTRDHREALTPTYRTRSLHCPGLQGLQTAHRLVTTCRLADPGSGEPQPSTSRCRDLRPRRAYDRRSRRTRNDPAHTTVTRLLYPAAVDGQRPAIHPLLIWSGGPAVTSPAGTLPTAVGRTYDRPRSARVQLPPSQSAQRGSPGRCRELELGAWERARRATGCGTEPEGHGLRSPPGRRGDPPSSCWVTSSLPPLAEVHVRRRRSCRRPPGHAGTWTTPRSAASGPTLARSASGVTPNSQSGTPVSDGPPPDAPECPRSPGGAERQLALVSAQRLRCLRICSVRCGSSGGGPSSSVRLQIWSRMMCWASAWWPSAVATAARSRRGISS